MALLSENWVGEKYHTNSSQQKAVAELLIRQFVFKKNDEILDVGCGDGKITAELAHCVPQGKVVGVDFSHSMIQFAQKKYRNENLKFIQGRAAEIEFTNQFNVITSFSALHWEPQQKEALIRFKNALKPQGSILFLIPGPENMLRTALKKLCSDPKWEAYFTNYHSPGKVWSANEYASLLLETGFMIQKIEAVERPYAFNEKAYNDYVEAMLPHLSQLPENRKKEFMADIVQVVKDNKHIDEHGHLRFDIRVLEIIAQRPS